MRRLTWVALACAVLLPAHVRAAERLCDTRHEDCRAPLLRLIANERQGIDVAFWFMQDQRYVNALILRHRAGVPVRVLVDPRADATKNWNKQMRDLEEINEIGEERRKTHRAITEIKENISFIVKAGT